ncbi:hypothetical protein Tco_1330359 [Tanacetum coccineum]
MVKPKASRAYTASCSTDARHARKNAMSSYLGCLAAVVELSPISNLWGERENRALFRGSRSASRIESLRVDDNGDSGYGGGDRGADAAFHSAISARVDGSRID